jgi:hypothetical protein
MKSFRFEVRLYLATALFVYARSPWNDKAVGAVTAAPPTDGGTMQWSCSGMTIAVQAVDATLPLPTPPFNRYARPPRPFHRHAPWHCESWQYSKRLTPSRAATGRTSASSLHPRVPLPRGCGRSHARHARMAVPDPNTVTALNDKQPRRWLPSRTTGQDDGSKWPRSGRGDDSEQNERRLAPPMFLTRQPVRRRTNGPNRRRAAQARRPTTSGLFFHYWQFVKPSVSESAIAVSRRAAAGDNRWQIRQDLNEVASSAVSIARRAPRTSGTLRSSTLRRPPHRG